MNPIKINNQTISPIVTSTFMGHYGDRILDIPGIVTDLSSAYRELRRIILRNRVTNFTKSSTFAKHNGNFFLWRPWTWKYVRRFWRDGMLNAYGLTNKGVRANAPKIASAIAEEGFNVIPNLYPQFAKGRETAIAEVLEAAQIYTDSLCAFFWALELNFSCPNDKVKIQGNIEDALACVKAVRKAYPNLVQIAKISIVHPYEFAQALVEAGVNIIHAINTIHYDLVYPNGPPSPLAAVGGGGVSGGPAFPQALSYNQGLRRKISVPIIMGCGVTNTFAAREYFDAGADAVSLCTVCRLNPAEAGRIIKSFAT